MKQKAQAPSVRATVVAAELVNGRPYTVDGGEPGAETLVPP